MLHTLISHIQTSWNSLTSEYRQGVTQTVSVLTLITLLILLMDLWMPFLLMVIGIWLTLVTVLSVILYVLENYGKEYSRSASEQVSRILILLTKPIANYRRS